MPRKSKTTSGAKMNKKQSSPIKPDPTMRVIDIMQMLDENEQSGLGIRVFGPDGKVVGFAYICIRDACEGMVEAVMAEEQRFAKELGEDEELVRLELPKQTVVHKGRLINRKFGTPGH